MLVELREVCIVSRVYVSNASHLWLHWRNAFARHLDLQNIDCSSSNLAVDESRCAGFISLFQIVELASSWGRTVADEISRWAWGFRGNVSCFCPPSSRDFFSTTYNFVESLWRHWWRWPHQDYVKTKTGVKLHWSIARLNLACSSSSSSIVQGPIQGPIQTREEK